MTGLNDTQAFFAAPEPTTRKFILSQGGRRVFHAVSRVQRRHKETILRARRHFHTVLDVVYVLEQASLTADNNVVDRGELLRVFCLGYFVSLECPEKARTGGRQKKLPIQRRRYEG